MLRTCTGADDTLSRKLEDGRYVACDCGKTFDDVEYSTLFPHEYIPTPEERRERIDAALLEHPEIAEELAQMGVLGPREK